MPTTFQAVAAFLIAILPGALTVWGFERVSGRWAIGLSDRILRFLGVSAVLHALAAPATYLVWHSYLRTGAYPSGEKLPLSLWGVALAYVAVPLGLGSLIAYGVKVEWPGFAKIVGATKAPTAWDAVFASEPTDLYVLMKLKSGEWVGGQYVEGSYVGGYPEPADIYLRRELQVDQDTEDFVHDANGEAVPEGEYGLLVRWSEIEFLVVTD